MKFNEELKTMETQRLLLRLFTKEDALEVTRLCQSEKIYHNTLYLPRPYTFESACQWIAKHEENYDQDKMYELAITDKATGQLLGAISLSHHPVFQIGEIGYWIGEEYWNRGYASEAAEAMLEFAFTVKEFHKVYARHFGSNPASGKVMQKIGMIYEGTLRDQVKKDDRYEDLACYGILKAEWIARHQL